MVVAPLIVSVVLFALGIFNLLVQKNMIRMLMGLELMLNAVNINMIVFAKLNGDLAQGQLFGLFIMLVAVAEIVVALAILVKLFGYSQNINPDTFSTLGNKNTDKNA